MVRGFIDDSSGATRSEVHIYSAVQTTYRSNLAASTNFSESSVPVFKYGNIVDYFGQKPKFRDVACSGNPTDGDRAVAAARGSARGDSSGQSSDASHQYNEIEGARKNDDMSGQRAEPRSKRGAPTEPSVHIYGSGGQSSWMRRSDAGRWSIGNKSRKESERKEVMEKMYIENMESMNERFEVLGKAMMIMADSRQGELLSAMERTLLQTLPKDFPW